MNESSFILRLLLQQPTTTFQPHIRMCHIQSYPIKMMPNTAANKSLIIMMKRRNPSSTLVSSSSPSSSSLEGVSVVGICVDKRLDNMRTATTTTTTTRRSTLLFTVRFCVKCDGSSSSTQFLLLLRIPIIIIVFQTVEEFVSRILFLWRTIKLQDKSKQLSPKPIINNLLLLSTFPVIIWQIV